MESRHLKKKPPFSRLWVILLLLVLPGLMYACQSQEPPLSPAAAAFKKEMKECIDRLAQPLTEPVLKGDSAAIIKVLKKTEPAAIKLCRMCPFRMGVMNKDGDTLAIYPPRQAANLDFYQYEVVQKVLKTRKIAQQRLFLQDGARIYAIAVPLLRGEEVIGILAIALDAGEAQKRWDLREKEFLVLNFNR
jgi:hypothetical protein